MASIRRLAIGVVFVASAAFADPVADALGYLTSKQALDGNFGALTSEEPFVATYEALLAFRSAGAGADPVAQNAELFLGVAAAPVDTELLLRREIALRTTAFTLTAISSSTHAPGFDAEDAWSLAWQLFSMRQAGQGASTAALQRALRLQAFASSGCFPVVDDEAGVELTALAVRALEPLNVHPSVAATRTAALSCLVSTQQAGGSFGSVGSTAAAMLALLGTGATWGSEIAAARGYLLATQLPNGSWGDVRTTALVVQALASGAPDWEVAHDFTGRALLTVFNPSPFPGTPLQVELVVTNVAATAAPAVGVRFIATPASGGPSFVASDAVLPALGPGQAIAFTAAVPTTNLSGKYTLTAEVDALRQFAELDRTNNLSTAFIDVQMKTDLAVTASSIQFVAVDAGQTRVDVSVLNLGTAFTNLVSVGVFRGNPASGGVRIGGATLPVGGLATNGTATVSVEWASASANGPTPIYAVVDELNAVAEADEGNNQAFRYYFPGQGTATDLAISVLSGGFTPVQPQANAPFTLTVVVQNLSPGAATSVPIAVYEAGVLRSRTELASIPGNGSASAVFSLTTPLSTAFTAVVDPDLLLNDPSRANNRRVFQTFGLAEAPFALSFSAPLTQASAPDTLHFSVTATAANGGAQPAQTFLRLVDRADGDKVLARLAIELAAHGTRPVALGPFVLPNHIPVLSACLDSDSLIPEANENDNCSELTLAGGGNAFLAVATSDLSFTPVGADVGEKVTLRATVHNNGSTAAVAAVEWWQGLPRSPAATLLGQSPISIPVGGQATAAFDWIRAEGLADIHAVVAQVVPKEGNPADNQAWRHLFLEQVVDLGLGTSGLSGNQVRVGRLTGGAAANLVLGYSQFFPATNTTRAGVALFEPDTNGRQQLVWRREVGESLQDVLLADLDADGQGEIAALSSTRILPSGTYSVSLSTLKPDGSLKWETVLPSSVIPQPVLGVGDLNGDQIPDLLYLVGSELRVFSGATGQAVLTVTLPALRAS